MPIVTSNGINIAWQERGRGQPLILIMGLGAPGALWEQHVAAYEKHFRCIMIDNRGAGLSDKPGGPYTTKMMADDVAGVMKELKLTNARVAGISMGSAIAQQLALSYPKLVRSLVLISSWARCDPYTKAVFDHFRQIRAQATPSDFMQLLQLWIFTPQHYAANLSALIQGLRDANFNPMPQHAFAAQCEACITHDTLDALGGIKVPALLTVGSADIFTPLNLSEAIHERLPKSELFVLKGWGHAHHWEALEEFNKKTLEFMIKN
ncbi:MAG TPA: alpha/beta hydrolase [Planctomycetota bacterium]|jgi:pimeloyl-ACP methyl ester carboxylesterase